MGFSYENHMKKFKFRIRACACILHIELCAGDSQPSHLKMLMCQQLFKHHASLLLKKCCVENNNPEFIFPEPQNAAVMCSYSTYVLQKSNEKF